MNDRRVTVNHYAAGYKLTLHGYCENCPNFSVACEKTRLKTKNYGEDDVISYTIYCEHEDMCRNIWQHIKKGEKLENST